MISVAIQDLTPENAQDVWIIPKDKPLRIYEGRVTRIIEITGVRYMEDVTVYNLSKGCQTKKPVLRLTDNNIAAAYKAQEFPQWKLNWIKYKVEKVLVTLFVLLIIGLMVSFEEHKVALIPLIILLVVSIMAYFVIRLNKPYIFPKIPVETYMNLTFMGRTVNLF